MFVRFGRYRFREGNEAEGVRLLRQAVESMGAVEGCVDAWLARGRHPSTEFIIIGRFRDEGSLRNYEGRLRSDPSSGSEFFSLLRLTTQPPEVTQYELLD